METISKEYDAIIDELADRARSIKSENKELDDDECVRQAIDDGLYYTDDRAYILAWALENGTITWGADIDWWAIETMLIEDILEEMKGAKNV